MAVALLLNRYGLDLVLTAPQEVIPGSYWGESEAGLQGNRLYARLDTPLHSILHEASHYICMTPERRAASTATRAAMIWRRRPYAICR